MAASTQSRDILVVEDSRVVRDMLAHIIQDEGYRVTGCSHAMEALDHLHRSPPPRLILLDLVLPYMQSSEFLQELQRDPRLADIPVVIISSYAYDEPQPLAHTVAYLEKPLDLEQLMGIVRQYCG